MNRQPRNVLVYVFRRIDGVVQFLLLRRSDDGVWQAVCGGVEGNESLDDAAERELREELGLLTHLRLRHLDTVGGAPRTAFGADSYWPEHIFIVEKHFFGAELDPGVELSLSAEHAELEWLGYEQAYERLAYSDDRLAIWELNARIRSGSQY